MKHPLNCRPVGRICYLLVLSLIARLIAPTAAQTCYYPNGSPSIENDVPCVKGAEGACCPDGWECYTNGLCYLPSEGYFGRYTCTDKTWNSPGCTNYCTHNKTATGNEAILNCNGTNWCCDANRPDAQDLGTGCCDTGVSGLFSLAIGKAGTPTGIGSSSPSSQAASSSQAPASSSSSRAPPSSASKTLLVPPSSTSEKSSKSSSESSPESAAPTSTAASSTIVVLTTSPSTGGVSFVTVTKAATGSSGSSEASVSAVTPVPASGTSSSSPTPASKSNTTNKAVIIGPAVAVPVLLIILIVIGFFLWRNRRNKTRNSAAMSVPSNYNDDDKSPPNTQVPYIYNAVEAEETTSIAGYRGVPHTGNNSMQPYPLSPTSAELEGRAISPTHSELAGSNPASAHFNRPLSYELPGSRPGVR